MARSHRRRSRDERGCCVGCHGHNRATWDTKADGAANVVADKVIATVELVGEE